MYSCAEDTLYHPVVIKQDQRFWRTILIVHDNVDITATFKAAIEDNNNTTLTKKIEAIKCITIKIFLNIELAQNPLMLSSLLIMPYLELCMAVLLKL